MDGHGLPKRYFGYSLPVDHFDSHVMARFLLPVAGDIDRHDFYAAAIDHSVGVQWIPVDSSGFQWAKHCVFQDHWR